VKRPFDPLTDDLVPVLRPYLLWRMVGGIVLGSLFVLGGTIAELFLFYGPRPSTAGLSPILAKAAESQRNGSMILAMYCIGAGTICLILSIALYRHFREDSIDRELRLANDIDDLHI